MEQLAAKRSHDEAHTRKTELAAARRARLSGKRPALTAAGAVPYLDWITANLDDFEPAHLEAHLRAVELAIRTLATEAQGKATQHTLVQDGTIDAPTL